MDRELAFILVGDHLGQVKKVLFPTGECSTLNGFGNPTSSDPIVSIHPFVEDERKQLIARKSGQLFVYDCVRDESKEWSDGLGQSDLHRAIPIRNNKVALVYDKKIHFDGKDELIKQKTSAIKCATVREDELAYAGSNISLRVIDIENQKRLFEAAPPDKDWLGIIPEIYVSDIVFVAQSRIATCSKSDSSVRVYDIRGKSRPIITTNFDKTAFNEHAEACRFHCITSTGDDGHTLVVGSNVGQVFAIDLRFNVKPMPEKKKLKPRNHKILGSFKGARGASLKDLKLVPALVPSYAGRDEEDTVGGHRLLTCSLDRYLRIYNFSKNNRSLMKHVYMKTKPQCCSPVFYSG